jgi:hypothetical protein
MRCALQNLISTPVAVLPRLDLRVGIGLSSEDPIVGRHQSEPYETYVSVYAPNGVLASRLDLGRIEPHRRRFIDVSSLVEPFGFNDNHLVVAHRVPSSLAARFGVVDEPVVFTESPDYELFRSYVQYCYPKAQGAHGGVIYEVPPRFNESLPGKHPPIVLTFTTKVVLSPIVTTSILLINYSTNPSYSTSADYRFTVHGSDGSQKAIGRQVVAPFTIGVLDLSHIISKDDVRRAEDSQDGLSHFCFYGICENASVAVLVLNLAPTLGGVSIEHTHPTQGYIVASPGIKQRIKREAVEAWRGLLTNELEHRGDR